MSLLDDARRLERVDPWYEDERAATAFCIACRAYADFSGRRHDPDCPWLSLPKIVAALEAADRFIERQGSSDDAEWLALSGALDA